MRIFITGGTGFIGNALCQHLILQGHQLTVLTRQPRSPQQAVTFCHDLSTLPNLNGFEAVINLAGEPIFAKRWSAKQKQRLCQSRLHLTQSLTQRIQQSDNPPHTFLSASATGFYGNLPFAKKADEMTACGKAFPAPLCQQWEKTALQAQSEKTRVCLLRTGLVLDQQGGALAKMLPLYRLGLGGKLGDGTQHWAWISLHDQVRAITFLLENPHCQGAYNLVAPEPIRNGEFNRLLAKALHRPAFFHLPAIPLKLSLGERSQLLLDNQPLVPQRLLDAGFVFDEPNLPTFLQRMDKK